jgi:DNA invertase Pin-like site-specific DNA recombinase
MGNLSQQNSEVNFLVAVGFLRDRQSFSQTAVFGRVGKEGRNLRFIPEFISQNSILKRLLLKCVTILSFGRFIVLLGYARVSTREQNPDLQGDALREVGCEKIFMEKASGAQRERPELLAALDYMRKEDILVVWKLDRLARSLKQLIETIEMLETRKKGFRSLTESIDTTTPGGRLIFHIFASLAEFERSVIRERTMAGLAAAKKSGRRGGRPPSLMDEDLIAARALLKDENISVEDVAKRLSVAPSTLYRHIPGGRSSV